MFIRATLRTRELPFAVTDIKPSQNSLILERGLEAMREAQTQAKVSGTLTILMI